VDKALLAICWHLPSWTASDRKALVETLATCPMSMEHISLLEQATVETQAYGGRR
jgi:hypothetical protein